MFIFFILIPLLNPTTKNIDGSLSDWSFDELIYDDPANDSAWGSFNEVDDLYVSWDENLLYFGVSGVQKDGNNLIVYIDAGSNLGYGDITSSSYVYEGWNPNLLWWWRRNHLFPPNFQPDWQWHLYEMKLNPQEGHGLYRFRYDNKWFVDNYNSSINQKSKGGGTSIYGTAEGAVPFTVLYPKGFPSGAKISFIAIVTGGLAEYTFFNRYSSDEFEVFEYISGTATETVKIPKDLLSQVEISDNKLILKGSAHDGLPNQNKKFTSEWYGQYTFDSFITVDLDSDRDGTPDIGRSPITRNISSKSSDKKVIISWDKKQVYEKYLSGFKLYRSTGSEKSLYGSDIYNKEFVLVKTLSPETTFYIDTEIENNKYYYYCITPIYNGTPGGKSELTEARPHGPKIIHTPIKNFSYIEQPLKIKASFYSELHPPPTGYLWYRIKGAFIWSTHTFTTTDFTFPDYYIQKDGIEYFLVGVDADGNFNFLPEGANEFYFINISTTYSETIDLQSPSLKIVLPDEDDSDSSETSIEFETKNLLTKSKIFIGVPNVGSIETEQLPIENPNISNPTIVRIYEMWLENLYGEKQQILFSPPATLTLRYFQSDLEGINNENNLRIFYWDGVKWNYLGGEVDTKNKTIKTNVNHLSRFGIFEAKSHLLQLPQSKKIQEIIRPIFFPKLGEVVEFKFSDQSYNPKIKILDIFGNIIIEFNGRNWDGKDSKNNTVESGPYLYQIITDDQVITGSCIVVR